MKKNTPDWIVQKLVNAQADASTIPDRLRAWRNEQTPRWSLEKLARELEKLAHATGRSDYELKKPALLAIEKGTRKVTLIEALGLAQVFDRTLADLLLPEGPIDEAEDWLLFEQAAKALERIRRDSAQYVLTMNRLRNRIEVSPHLRGHLREVLKAAMHADDLHARAGHARRSDIDQMLRAKGLETEEVPPFETWRLANVFESTAEQIAAEHAVLRTRPLGEDIWFLGWNPSHHSSEWSVRRDDVQKYRSEVGLDG